MSVFEFAMKMEQDGEKYYRELAEKATNAGLKRIFNYLADEEVKHYNLFSSLAQQQVGEYRSADILADSQNIFAEMKNSGGYEATAEASQIEAYRHAMEMEKKSYRFYEEKRAEATEGEAKKFLEKIAREERSHYRLMEGIIEFVTRPESWIESAEFNHLTDY